MNQWGYVPIRDTDVGSRAFWLFWVGLSLDEASRTNNDVSDCSTADGTLSASNEMQCDRCARGGWRELSATMGWWRAGQSMTVLSDNNEYSPSALKLLLRFTSCGEVILLFGLGRGELFEVRVATAAIVRDVGASA